jgi:1,2-diacylglycerol 3-alpha-glucosyltransferase
MKVVMLCEFYNENLEYQENHLVKYYRKHKIDVTVITSTLDSVFDYYGDKHDLYKPTRIYEHQGAKIIKLQYKYIRLFKRLRRYKNISSILEEEKPDLIYVHDIMLNLPEAVDYHKKYPKCKIIMDYHADYTNSGKNFLSLWILHRLIRRCFFLSPSRKYISKIFPIIPGGFTFLKEIYGVRDEEMELLPLGGDTDMAEEVRRLELGISVRKKLQINSDQFVIFTGGKLNEMKKTHLLISAIKELGTYNVHLIVVGKAENEDYNQKLFSLANGQSNIHFVGWLNNRDVYAHLNASNIAIFPASQSVLWQQSICMYLPLVVGDLGGQSIDYLNDYNNIIELKAHDITINKIKDVIHMLISDEGKRLSMSLGAEKVTKEKLDWNHLIFKTLAFNETN